MNTNESIIEELKIKMANKAAVAESISKERESIHIEQTKKSTILYGKLKSILLGYNQQNIDEQNIQVSEFGGGLQAIQIIYGNVIFYNGLFQIQVSETSEITLHCILQVMGRECLYSKIFPVNDDTISPAFIANIVEDMLSISRKRRG